MPADTDVPDFLYEIVIANPRFLALKFDKYLRSSILGGFGWDIGALRLDKTRLVAALDHLSYNPDVGDLGFEELTEEAVQDLFTLRADKGADLVVITKYLANLFTKLVVVFSRYPSAIIEVEKTYDMDVGFGLRCEGVTGDDIPEQDLFLALSSCINFDPQCVTEVKILLEFYLPFLHSLTTDRIGPGLKQLSRFYIEEARNVQRWQRLVKKGELIRPENDDWRHGRMYYRPVYFRGNKTVRQVVEAIRDLQQQYEKRRIYVGGAVVFRPKQGDLR